jgi:hypothetical protein
LRRKARGRPQMLQRLRCWVENLGFLFVLAIFAVVAIFSFVGPSGLSLLAIGPWPLALTLHFQLVLQLQSFAVINSPGLRISLHLHPEAKSQWLIAKSCLLPKRHPETLKQRPCLIVVTRRGHDGHVHALPLVHLRVIDFRKNQLVAQAERVIAATVK